VRSLVIAGATSGVGKTTIACAVMAAYRARGQRVQPFKAGPDYIDPSHHSMAARRASRNLDTVLVPPANMRVLFERAASSADIAVVEGVMGLFDGRNGRDEEGSTAQIAKLLGAPVVVVIDVSKTSRTAGAIALGCARFDPALSMAGFILNRVGSETHARVASEAVEQATGLPVLGCFPRDAELTLPERHLGLVPTGEAAPTAAFFDRLAESAQRHLDLERMWKLAEHHMSISTEENPSLPNPPPPGGREQLFPEEAVERRVRIVVARDSAFNFYYEDNLDLLQEWGAELVSFSPLANESLPTGTQGVYLGGGFPELFAPQLAENRSMLASLRRAAAAGLPIYAECGGLMYLGRTLTDFEGHVHEMVGVLPVDSAMQRKKVTLGYRSATALRSSPILPESAQVMGHEFHYSELANPAPQETAAYRLAERDGALEGYARGNVLASYVHLHFGGRPDAARRFIDLCAEQRND
jgi:cobyrinic acid a,c-diamide synthase